MWGATQPHQGALAGLQVTVSPWLMTPHSPAGGGQGPPGPSSYPGPEDGEAECLILFTFNDFKCKWPSTAGGRQLGQQGPASPAFPPVERKQIRVPVLTPGSGAADSAGPVSSLTNGRRLRFSVPSHVRERVCHRRGLSHSHLRARPPHLCSCQRLPGPRVGSGAGAASFELRARWQGHRSGVSPAAAS